MNGTGPGRFDVPCHTGPPGGLYESPIVLPGAACGRAWATAKQPTRLLPLVVHVRVLVYLMLLPLLMAGFAPIQAGLVPDIVEPPLASEAVGRGGITVLGTSEGPVAGKTVDGDPSDWVGSATRIGGSAVHSRGEYVYQDFLFDDAGADDGRDATRLALLEPAVGAEERLFRAESLSQALGVQFDAGPADPTGGTLIAREWYGDAAVPAGARGTADLVEFRVAADADSVHLLARFVAMRPDHEPALLVLVDTVAGGAPRSVPFGAGLETGAEWAFLVTPAGVRAHDLVSGVNVALAGLAAAADATGFTNALEASLPRGVVAPDGVLSLAVGAGLAGPDGLLPVATGEGASNLLNVAYRDEPVWLWSDQTQSLLLHAGNIDATLTSIDLERLDAGATDAWVPTPGYHERVFASDPQRSRESGQNGTWQPYGLYLPPGWVPGTPVPASFWLHWRGGTAHQAAAWTPRVFLELGDNLGGVVAAPHGRGTSGWYVGESHRDFWEVYEDLHNFVAIDEDRRYLAGYSMGGYGTYLLGLLYPDLFAGGYSVSGALTQGAWLGLDDGGSDVVEADGDARRQLIYPLLENARHLGLVIHHGTDDELVPVSGVARVAERLTELGYAHRTYIFPGYEHYTQAVVDEWSEGARFLAEQVRDANPGRVTYVRVPALEDAVATINAPAGAEPLALRGAYWIDALHPRQVDLSDPTIGARADVRSDALPQAGTLIPEAGVAALGHSTPFVMAGLQATMVPAVGTNSFDADLENVDRLRLDLARMGLETAQRVEASISTDGDARLLLAGSWSQPTVLVDGVAAPAAIDGDALVIELSAGTWSVAIDP